MATFQSWQDIKTLRYLEISSSRGNTEERNIFSNGFNNVDVIIHLQAENESGEIITDIPATQVLEHSFLITYESGDSLYRSYINDGPKGTWFYNTNADQWTLEPPPNILQKAQAVEVEDPIDSPYYRLKKNDLSEHKWIGHFENIEGLSPESDVSAGVEIANTDEEYNAQRAQRDAQLHYDQAVDVSSASLQSNLPPSYEQFPGIGYQEGFIPEQESIQEPGNEYSNPVISENEWASGSFYVRRNGSVYGSLQIAVRVLLTHPRRSVEYISTDGHSASGIKDYVTIRSHIAIDYSDPKNVIIPNRESIVSLVASNSLEWTARFSNLGPYYTHRTGNAEYAYIDFTPRIGGYFKVARLGQRFLLSDFDISGYNYAAWAGTTENVFSGIQPIPSEPPIAVMSSNGRVNIFYFANSSNTSDSYIAFNGVIFFRSSSYTYRFAPGLSLDYHSNPGDNPAKLIRVKFTMYENNATNYNWSNVYGSPLIMSLQDIYGNDGFFQFAFNSDNYFDVPGAV